MNNLIEASIYCPYCGEKNPVLIEPLDEAQEYIEDCQVCCRPMVITIAMQSDDTPVVTVRREDDTL